MLLSVPLTIVARIALETTEGGYRLAVIRATAALRASLRQSRSEENSCSHVVPGVVNAFE